MFPHFPFITARRRPRDRRPFCGKTKNERRIRSDWSDSLEKTRNLSRLVNDGTLIIISKAAPYHIIKNDPRIAHRMQRIIIFTFLSEKAGHFAHSAFENASEPTTIRAFHTEADLLAFTVYSPSARSTRWLS